MLHNGLPAPSTQIPAPTPLLGCFSSPLGPLALPQGPGYPGGPPASPARARAAGGAVGQPRASPPPRGDVTMPEPQSSWAGSAHSPVKTTLIGRASVGRAGPVGGRTPSWPGLRLLSPRSGAPNRPGVPGPAPPPARRARPRPRAHASPGPAPGGGARQLPPLIGRAPTAQSCAELNPAALASEASVRFRTRPSRPFRPL